LTHPVQTFAGGSAVNTATHLAALDSSNNNNNNNHRVTLYSALNPTDDYGKLLLLHAKRHGIPWKYHSDETASTGHCVVMVTNNERSFMTHQGVVQGFGVDQVPFHEMVLDTDDTHSVHVHIAGFYNMPRFWNGPLVERLEWLKRQDKRTTTSLVTQHDASEEWDGGISDLLPLLDFVFMNELEARHVTREQPNDNNNNNNSKNAQIEDSSIQHWVDYFSRVAPMTYAIITRGERGAMAIRNGTIVANQAAVQVTPIDPTGAGDAFCAGFFKGLWEESSHDSPDSNCGCGEWPIEKIRNGLLMGCSVATCSVLTRGASFPSDPAKISDFIDRTKELL
jgi:sugar/nucleoside kinase (ribokinase family)